MSETIAADTDRMKRAAAFTDYTIKMKAILDQFATDAKANGPVVPTVRGKTDEQIQELTKGALATMETVLETLSKIASGDETTLKRAADMFQKMEHEITSMAADTSISRK